jgi:hypothetical protein
MFEAQILLSVEVRIVIVACSAQLALSVDDAEQSHMECNAYKHHSDEGLRTYSDIYLVAFTEPFHLLCRLTREPAPLQQKEP